MVFFDALRVKIRDEGLVRNKAVYLALAITSEGDKEGVGAVDRPDRGGQVLARTSPRACLSRNTLTIGVQRAQR